MAKYLCTLVALTATVGLAAAEESSCGTGTVFDEETQKCVWDGVIPPTRAKRSDTATIKTNDGSVMVELPEDGRFGVKKSDGNVEWSDHAQGIPGAIELGYNLFKDVRELHNMIDVKETLRKEIASVSNDTRQQNAAFKGVVDAALQQAVDDVDKVKADVAADLDKVKADVTTGLNKVNADVTADLGKVKADVAAGATDLGQVNKTANALTQQLAKCAAQGYLYNPTTNKCVLPGKECPSLGKVKIIGGGMFEGFIEAATGSTVDVVCPTNASQAYPIKLQCLRSSQWSHKEVHCLSCAKAKGCDAGTQCNKCAPVKGDVKDLKCTQCTLPLPGSSKEAPAVDCKEVNDFMNDNKQAKNNGLFWLKGGYQVYCDFTVEGGGWTLVSTVHENNVGSHGSGDDRWSGSSSANAWVDDKTFGSIGNAAKDDYKSKAYKTIAGDNLMVWHVSNGASMNDFKSKAVYRYTSSNAFLGKLNPKNMAGIFKGNREMKAKSSMCSTRLVVPYKFDTGNMDTFYKKEISPYLRSSNGAQTGKMEFGTGTDDRASFFAFCPFTITKACANHEHGCMGGVMRQGGWNSDYSAWDHNGRAGPGQSAFAWSTGGDILRQTTFFFIR